jgi:hypothetical protein
MAKARALCQASPQRGEPESLESVMSIEAVQSFFALAIGFALAGALASGYQAATSRPASFRLLQRGSRPHALAAVPFLVFAAPFIIMRNILRPFPIDSSRFWVVLWATIVAGFWSLMSGTVAIAALGALGLVGV